MLTPTFGYANDFDPAWAPRAKAGDLDYAWELVTMFPPQGEWSEEEYLVLTDSTNRLIEYSDGQIEFIPMPTFEHQAILAALLSLFTEYSNKRSPAWVLPAGLRVLVPKRKFREPDIVYLSKDNPTPKGERYFTGADLVVEIVSPDERSIIRDYDEKRALYAAAGIAEYWIVDPQEAKITVLTLPEGATAYAEHGVFHSGDTATSKLLEGFVVDVKACFDAAKV